MHSKVFNTRKFVTASLFSALICVATYFAIPVPITQGYANLGDCFIIVAALTVGGGYGAVAGAVGASLADLIAGYAIYAPATFIIKALMALVAYFLYVFLLKITHKLTTIWVVISAIAAEIVMVGGYFIFEMLIYDFGVAVADIFPNSIQGLFGIVGGTIITLIVLSNSYLRRNLWIKGRLNGDKS